MAQPGRGRAPRRLRGRRDPGSGRRRAGRLRRSTVSSDQPQPRCARLRQRHHAREGRAAPVGAWRGCDRLRTTARARAPGRRVPRRRRSHSTTCCSATSPARASSKGGHQPGSGGRCGSRAAARMTWRRVTNCAFAALQGAGRRVGEPADGGAAPVPAGPRITLRVVGISRTPTDLSLQGSVGGVLLLPRAFVVAHGEQIGDFSVRPAACSSSRLTDGGLGVPVPRRGSVASWTNGPSLSTLQP